MLSIGSQPSVFVSHSRYDTDSISYFAKIFASAGIKATFMEWEKIDKEYAGSRVADIIRSEVIQNTRAVIVLLGKNLKTPPTFTPQYTHNWVNFEVGVSAGCRKPVWVFEKMEEFIDFPIPFVSDYVKYHLENVDHLRSIGSILKDRVVSGRTVKPPYFIKCNHENCNAEYNFWNKDVIEFNCPVCRQPLKIIKKP